MPFTVQSSSPKCSDNWQRGSRPGCPTSAESCPTCPGILPRFPAESCPTSNGISSAQKRDDGNEMMLLASLATKFLTHVAHFGDHSRNQRRFAPTLPHFTGIGAPRQRNPHLCHQQDRAEMLCSSDSQADFANPKNVRGPIGGAPLASRHSLDLKNVPS